MCTHRPGRKGKRRSKKAKVEQRGWDSRYLSHLGRHMWDPSNRKNGVAKRCRVIERTCALMVYAASSALASLARVMQPKDKRDKSQYLVQPDQATRPSKWAKPRSARLAHAKKELCEIPSSARTVPTRCDRHRKRKLHAALRTTRRFRGRGFFGLNLRNRASLRTDCAHYHFAGNELNIASSAPAVGCNTVCRSKPRPDAPRRSIQVSLSNITPLTW